MHTGNAPSKTLLKEQLALSYRGNTRLAISGGEPARDPNRKWPRWPVAAPECASRVQSVLASDRWALTGRSSAPSMEHEFALAFANFTEARYCIPVDHGSSALLIALEALELPFGAPVVVPTLTWVASASAVLRAGLVPVLCDVDEHNGCLSVANLPQDISYAAIVAVHWACSMVDMCALESVVGTRVPVVEDCAQAIGSRMSGRRAGTSGRFGCFSFQQAKTLSVGEGGAVVTADIQMTQRLEELRADSRSRVGPGGGAYEGLALTESASMMGANLCMSEVGAAIALAQLSVFEDQLERRARNFSTFKALIDAIDGVSVPEQYPRHDEVDPYEVPVIFETVPIEGNTWLAKALTAELGIPIYPPRAPLHRSRLLRPSSKTSFGPLTSEFDRINRGREYPHAEYLAAHAVMIHHQLLLGEGRDLEGIATAIQKVLSSYRH